MKYRLWLLVLLIVLIIGLSVNAYACDVRIIIVDGETQTWQVCCFPGGVCQYTRIS